MKFFSYRCNFIVMEMHCVPGLCDLLPSLEEAYPIPYAYITSIQTEDTKVWQSKGIVAILVYVSKQAA